MITGFNSIKCQTRNFQGDTQTEMNSNASNEYSASLEKIQKAFDEAPPTERSLDVALGVV
ncbi:hypothetical protein GCM10027454_13180 [Algoriphagus aestuariicola]